MRAANIFSVLAALSGVTRFSGCKLIHRENVLEHTGAVVLICLLLGEATNARMGMLLGRAAVHDLDETITGDVSRPTKYFSAALRAEMQQLEDQGMQDLAEALDAPWLPVLHDEAKDDSLEGYILRFADLMAAAHRVWEEVLVLGNHSMVAPACNLRAVLKNFIHAEAPPHAIFNKLHTELDAMLAQVCSITTPLVTLHAHTNPRTGQA